MQGYVYNAVDVDTFPSRPSRAKTFLFLSRVAPEKGPQFAVEVAKRTGRRLIIAGKVDRTTKLFQRSNEGFIDGEQIVFVGEADADASVSCTQMRCAC